MNNNQLVSVFQALELTELDEHWVESMNSAEFTEEPDIEFNLSRSLLCNLRKCTDALREYLKKLSLTDELRSSLLYDLLQVGITSKVIKSWLYCILFNGLKLTANFNQKVTCLQAVDLYFLLLRIPGMNSSELYHPIIFEKSIDSLLMLTHTRTDNVSHIVQRKRKGEEKVTSSGKRKKHDTDAVVSEMETDDIVVLSVEDTSILTDKLSAALSDLCHYLACVSLRSHETAVQNIIRALVKLALFFQSNCPVTLVDYKTFKEDGSTAQTLSLPYQLAIYGLSLVVSVKHGNLAQVSLTLFRFIVEILIMKNATGSSVPRAYYQNSEIFRRLVCHLYDLRGDAIAHSISVLSQNLIAQCPDRLEFRNHCAVIVSCILNHMPAPWIADFNKWLRCMAFHAKASYRSNAVAVFAKLLCLPERQFAEENIESESTGAIKHGFMLNVVIGRLRDVAPSVRCRALGALVEIMEANVVSPSVLKCAVGNKEKNFEDNMPQDNHAVGNDVTPSTLYPNPVSKVVGHDTVLGTQSSLLYLLSKCSIDMKSMVRKAAVHAVERAICHGFLLPTAESINIICDRCRDSALYVRKFAVGSMTSVLLHYPNCMEAISAWATGVVPALHDIENSVQEKALKHMEEIMLDSLSSSDNKKELAWRVMDFMASGDGDSITTYFTAACVLWKRQSKLNTSLMHIIIDKLSDCKHRAAAWMFLRFYSLYIGNEDSSIKIYHIWEIESEKENPLLVQINSIIVLGRICKSLPNNMKKQAFDVCDSRLKSQKCPVQLVSYLVETILHLVEAIHQDAPGQNQWPQPMMQWGEATLKQADEFLYNTFFFNVNKETLLKNESLIHQLYVAGNVGKHCVKQVPKRLVLTIQALLTSRECLTAMPQNPEQLSQNIPPSQPLSQFAQDGEVPSNIRAHALINLGRLCLNNDVLAEKCVPAIIRELDTSTNEMMKTNALIVLADLCVQQTQLIDGFIPDIANCLGDESAAVRKNTLVLISSLLKRDFVKWRGSLIFKFLAMLCDSNNELRDLVRYSLVNQTLQRNGGDVFFRHFVESLFYFNAYTKHNTYNRFSKSNKELRYKHADPVVIFVGVEEFPSLCETMLDGTNCIVYNLRKSMILPIDSAFTSSLFDFSGIKNVDRRMTIYYYMLDHMDDEHRIKLVGKLCCDILDAVVDGTLPLNDEANPILADALSIISSQQIKLRCMKPVDEDQIEEENQAYVASTVLKQKIISQVVKQNLLENIVPIIIALKNKLVSCKSFMAKNVMECLKEIMKDYKTEVQDILAADRQLAAEIEFDLKRYDREQHDRINIEKQTMHGAQAVASARPGCNNVENVSSPLPRKSTASRCSVDIPTGSEQAGSSTTKRVDSSDRQKENAPTPGRFQTPAIRRHRGLGIETMLNSARKAMSLLKVPNNDNKAIDGDGQRATSTPARQTALSDLTFSNFNEISVIATSAEAGRT